MNDTQLSNRIVGGKVLSQAFQYPFIITLAYNGTTECGGTLLSPSKILTAAHCTVGDITKWTAKVHRQDLRKTDAEEGGMTFKILKRRYYPDFNENSHEGDAAVWTIWGNIKLPYYPQLDDGTEANKTGNYLNVIGWGSEYYKGPLSPQLREVKVPIVDSISCQFDYYQYIYQYINSKLHICAGYSNGGFDACAGDSGGPAFISTESGATIVGISSFGFLCALPNFPGIYTKVAGVRDWILSQVNDYST